VEFSLPTYLAAVRGWHPSGDQRLVALLADHVSHQHINCRQLADCIDEARGARRATCFPSDFASFNDLNLHFLLQPLIAHVTLDISQIEDSFAGLDATSAAAATVVAIINIQRTLLERMRKLMQQPTPPPPPPPPFQYTQPSVLIQIAIDIGRTFFVSLPGAGKKPEEAWRTVTDGAGFTPYEFPGKLKSTPSPLGWPCVVQMDKDHLMSLIEGSFRAKAPFLDPDNARAEFLFFTTGIGFLLIRAPLTPDAASSVQMIDRDPINYWTKGDELPFDALIAIYVERFIKMLERHKCIEFVDLQRPRGPSPQDILKGSYILFSLRDSTAFVSTRRNKDDCTLSVSGGCAKLFVDWDIACLWPASATTSIEAFRDACQDVDAAIIVANAGWFGFVIMDDFLTQIGQDAIVEMVAGKDSSSRKVTDVGLAFLQAADAMYPIRWTRRNPHLEMLKFVHKQWETSIAWRRVEERVQWLAAYHQEREAKLRRSIESRLAMGGLILGAFVVISAIVDVFHLYYGEAGRLWTGHEGWVVVCVVIAPILVATVLIVASLRRRPRALHSKPLARVPPAP
jgi:hypothetical protein